MLLTLAAVALAPMLLGAASFVIESGSMEPAISVGDVVVGTQYVQPGKVAVGRVYIFDNPSATKDHPVVHRIVELRDDGDYTTAGDANEVTDIEPLKTDAIRARAVLLAPYIGLPAIWGQSGQWLYLALWLLLTVAAFFLASRDLDGEPPKSNLWNLLRGRIGNDEQPAPETTSSEAAATGTPKEQLLTRRRTHAPAVIGIALAILATGLGTANAGFTGNTRNSGSTWTVGQWSLPYVSAVLADSPHMFWLLDDDGPTWAADRSGNHRAGRFGNGVAFGQTGSLPNNPGTSVRTGTGTGVPVVTTTAVSAPTRHAVEMWVNTTSTTGGYLAGFESTNRSDRVLRMNAAGRLTYGDWDNNPNRILTTTDRLNDGAWHHVVVATNGATPRSQTTIYVDGVVSASGESTRPAAHTGFWHIGGGTGSPAFTGRIDNVAIYPSTLSAARVTEHYRVR